MPIIDMIRKMSANKHELKEKFKQMQEQDRLDNMLNERKKSSNRRELEAHIKKQEEEQITTELKKIRKREQSDFFSSKNSILKSDFNVLTDNKKLLTGGSSILKQKNIFLDNKSNIPMVNKSEHMFFK